MERCRQIICSQRKAICVVSSIIVAIFLIALVAAFARPSCEPCASMAKSEENVKDSTVSKEPIATNGEPFPWKNIRLPDTIIPETYSIYLHPNLTTFNFNGYVDISFYVRTSTNFLVLNSRNLNVSSISIQSLSVGRQFAIEVVKQLEYIQNQQIYISFGQKLEAGNRYQLKLEFAGILSANLAGFYKSSYRRPDGEKR